MEVVNRQVSIAVKGDLATAVYIAATLFALVAPSVALAIKVAVRVHLLRIRYQPAKLASPTVRPAA